MSDGWQTANGGGKSKKKKKAPKVQANGKKLDGDSGAPMKMRQVELTGFAKAEAMALEKAKRKQAAAAQLEKSKGRKVDEEKAREDRRKQKLIDQYDTGGKKGGKKKKKVAETLPIEGAVKDLDFDKIDQEFAKGQERSPDNRVEQLKQVLGSLHQQLARCGDVSDETELLESPLCYLTDEGHSRLSTIFNACEEDSSTSIVQLLAVCVKEAADLAENNQSSVGIMLMVQFVVKRQRENPSGPNYVDNSLPMLVNHFYTKDLFPTDRNLISIVRSYTQSVKIPAVYIRFWVRFFLFTRPDKQASEGRNEPVIYGAPKTVAKLATSYFGRVFDENKKHATIVREIFSMRHPKTGKVGLRPPLRPQELLFLLFLGYGETDTPDGANKAELLRAIPYFLYACLETAPASYFVDLLPYFSKAPIQPLREFLIKCVFKEGKCFDIMSTRFPEFPVEAMHAFVSVVQTSTDRSTSFRKAVLSTSESIAKQNAAAKAAEEEKKHPKAKKIARMDFHAQQLETVEAMLNARSGTHPILWLMLLVSATLFVVLFFHLVCQLKLVPAMAGPCATFEGGKVFTSIEQFYVKIEPLAGQAEVHGSAAFASIKETCAPAVDAVSPYVSAALVAAGEVAGPPLAAAEEATRDARHNAMDWINTVAWPLLVVQLEAAAPVVNDMGELVMISLGRLWTKLAEVCTMAADAAGPALDQVYPALEAAWAKAAELARQAVEATGPAQTAAIEAYNAAYDKVLVLIG